MNDNITRRNFMKSSGMIAVGLVAPSWLSTIARADVVRQSKGGKLDPDCVLVVCQLSGGNDGLNTVVPYANSRYYQLRPTLAVKESDVLKINEQIGFHPALAGLAGLYKSGHVAVIQNVGYPNPNRSHFKSMDIWQSASPEQTLKYGWVGRTTDSLSKTAASNPVLTIGLSTEKPLALQADKASIPCFASLADIQAMVGDPDAERRLREISGVGSSGSAGQVVVDANRAALDAMVVLRDQLTKFKPTQTYGKDRFGEGFRQIAQIVATSPQTRVVYFSAGGFDTHANQPDQHANLLQGFGDAIAAFQAEMAAIGKDKKVVVLVFSEFGRRSYENASHGTDHGAAAPMFLVGSRVKGGLYGPMPDLENLADGDLRYSIDFRQVYATALDDWMGADSSAILGKKFDSLGLV
ncbi:MAG: DUF1501 domain-containing protein [Chthonomonas sp.]|nr:DUF1501 domain-containing protein [Chthonomonas sp.]